MKRQSARFARPPRAGFGRTRYGGCLPPPGSATPTCSNDSASDRVPHAGRHLALVSDLGVGPIRVVGLLDSATHRPAVTVFGRDTYPDLGAKAAVPLESLMRNHTLVDGNKRLGWLAPVVFYGLNDVESDAPDDDAYNLVVALASGAATYQDAAAQLSAWH